jgi:hypothetical protein
MSVRDTKLIVDLFLNDTTVVSTPDFNMLYDLFMVPPRKIMTAI